jgi:lipopolysaccharide biosynthesis glycosyltransferase
MEPVALALASNDRYFPGLYCAVASALCHLDAAREADVRVLDGGVSETSRELLSRLVGRFGKRVRLHFVPIDESIFRGTTLGPGRSHMAYCRILLPQLLDTHRVIYVDCDALVFRDLSELFDFELSPGNVLAAVPDSETLTLGDDSRAIAIAMNLPADTRYYNSGVMRLDLNELRKQNFTQQSLDFFKRWEGHYRFHEQSAINFLLHDRIAELPEHWNRASWRFDEQENNDLHCVLHYTCSAPWLVETSGPAQVLFERFAAEAGLSVNRRSPLFRTSARHRFWRNAIAPLRALAFPIASLWYRLIGKTDKSAAYAKVARYWLDYICSAPTRRRLHHQRSQEIRSMKFHLHASPLVS